VVTKLDFSKIIQYHSLNKYELTIGFTKFEYKSPFGVLEIEGGRLKNILEKPGKLYDVSAGIYVLNSSALDFVPHNTFFTVPELVKELLKAGKKVGTYQIKEFWVGIEHIDQFDQVLKELNRIGTD